MVYDLCKDLSSLTTLPESSLHKIIDKTLLCISNDVYEQVLQEENLCTVDIGIGTLTLKIEDNAVRYKFIPSVKLEDMIRKIIVQKINPLAETTENVLSARILDTYKDFL